MAVLAGTCFARGDINAQPGYAPGMQECIHPLSSCILGTCLKEKVVLYSLGISEEDPAASKGCWCLRWMCLTTPHQPSLCLRIHARGVIHHPERHILLMGFVPKSYRIQRFTGKKKKQAKQSLPEAKLANMDLEDFLFCKEHSSTGCCIRSSCSKVIIICHWQCGYPKEFLACLNWTEETNLNF